MDATEGSERSHPRRRRVLICSALFWQSAIQISAHHYARCFATSGWEVGFLSAPVTPFHAAAILHSQDHRDRFRAWWQRGRRDCDGGLVHYTPQTLLPLSSVLGLRYSSVLRHWQDATVPRLSKFLAANRLLDPELLIVDTALYGFLFEQLRPGRSVYRVTDYNPAFASATPELFEMEREAARRADVVVYTASELAGYVESLGAAATALVPNGVDMARFARETSPPPDYSAIPEPRVVYVGSVREWFHFDLVNRLARAMPDVSFVVIGPDYFSKGSLLARPRFVQLPNLHILGQRPYDQVPRYLSWATVGLIPFDRDRHPLLVDHVNPLKLYEYMAAGLPVVASSWREIQKIGSPAILCETAEEMGSAIRRAIAERDQLSLASLDFAADHDWSVRFLQLLAAAGV